MINTQSIFDPKDDKALLNLEETFAADQGLYWSDGTAPPKELAPFLQAESAKISPGAKIKKNAIGDSFADFPRANATITFPLGNNGIAGETKLIIHYAQNDPKGPRKMLLSMNGKKIRTLTFPNTGSWDRNWKTLTTSIPLVAGSNELALTSQKTGGPAIDKILIKD